nr:xylulose kinase-1 [Tanacetum cinerariifolium]
MIKVLPPKTVEEVVARERERKTRTTLLMALPEDHLAKFHKMADAKKMWKAIKSRFGGNDESKKIAEIDVGYNGNKGRDTGRRPTYQDDLKALVTIDGEDIDWSGHVEEDTQNYAMMSYSFSNSGSDNEVKSCSKTCEESYARLKKLYDEQRDKLGDASVEIIAYTLALKKVEAQLLCHQQNQLAYEQKIRLLNAQMSANDKFGLRYGDYRYDSILSYENEVLHNVFINKESDLEDTPVNDRYANGMHAVPPPMTGNYMPYGPDVDIDYSKFTYGPKQPSADDLDSKTSNYASCESNSSVERSTSVPEPVVNESKAVCEPKAWTDAPIIKEENIKEKGTPNNCPKIEKKDRYGHTRKGLRYAFTRKSCFVCGNFSHLIRDCDFYEKRMAKQAALTKSKSKVTGQKENRPVWNNAQRVNHQNNKELASPKKTALGKDISYPFMAGSLPKTIWVLALEQSKTAQDLVIKKLQKKVKRIKRKIKARTPGMTLFKIVLDLESEVIDIKSSFTDKIEKLEDIFHKLEEENRILKEKSFKSAKIDTSAPVEDKEESLKQGRMIADMDEDVEDIDKEEPAKVEEVLEVVTAAKLITEVVTIVEPTTTTAQVPKESTLRKRRGVVIQDPKERAASVIVHTENDVIEQVNKSERQNNAVMRYQALKRKPLTEAQARKNMMIYLKNMSGFKMNFFKGMTYGEIRPLFEKHYNSNQAFLEKVKEEVTVQDNEIEEEGNKRQGESLEHEISKKQSMNEEAEELKRHLQIVANDDDDVYAEATPLASKVHVVDYQIHYENNKPYYKIIRADGSHKLFLSFITLLKNFDREDLETLWKLVTEMLETTEPKNFSDDFLLNILRIMFEKPVIKDNVWKDQKGRYGLAKVKGWKLFESCGVHIITFTTTQMFLLVEKKYPLTHFTLQQMLNNQMLNNVRLEVEKESEMSLELLRLVRRQNGNGPVSVITDTNGMIKVLPPKTAEEVVVRERERKTRTTLLMALLEDHLAKFHKMADAKEMWKAIKLRFGGNDDLKARDNGRRPAFQDDSKALVTIDGEDIDCSGHVEEDA